MATTEEQLATAQKLLGEKEVELRTVQEEKTQILLAGQQLFMAVQMEAMLRPLAEIVAKQERISAFQLRGRVHGTTMAVTRKIN